MALSGMRGLSVFIYDVRNCQNKEQERLRVDKELGNIRTKFKSEKGISPYKKKKYVWKMLYIFMLGYDVDFGHMEAGSLISAPKYPEKQVEYITTSCLLNENHDFLRLAINTIRNDIIGRNETFQCLALTMVGNIGRKDFAESLSPDVQKLLMSSSCRPLVRKKAALCLLRLFRKNPDVLNIDGWPDQRDRMSQLLDELDLGVLTASPSLLVALVSNNHESYWNCVRKCVKILERLARNQDVPQEYTYYGIPSPWLQVKSMRALQYFPTVEDPNMRRSLFEVLQRVLMGTDVVKNVLQRVLMGTDVVKNVNKNNASHAVLFEALALVMHLDAEKKMMAQCVALLGKFIAVRELNIRYLGRENMARMLMVTDVHDIIKRHQAQIITSLKDPDISIRRRALDLLYGMCDVSNAKDIVEALLQCTAELAMWEELSLKAAILAEKFAPDLSWYVDVILQLIDKAGEFVSDDIWFRVVQFVTSNEGLQPYAVVKAREYLEKSAVHETMIKVSAYILGELGHLLGRRPGCSPRQLFSLIYEKLPTVPTSTIPLLLSSYAKILMHCQPADQELHNQIWALFQKMKAIQLSSYAKILMHPHLQGFLNYCVAQLIYPYIGEREEDESFTFLPDDIIVTEILPRLHIKPLFRFKCASKRYRSIISHPVFARNYLNRTYKNDNSPKSWSSSGLLATLLYPFTNMSSYGHGLSANVRDLTDTLNSGTQFPDDAVCVSYVSLPYNNSHRIRASSNGLVLSHFHDRSLNELIDPLCVSNPLTKHCVKLPKQGLKLYSVHWELAIATRRVQTGSTFLTYKVVAIQRFLGLDDAFTTVHIFSSDTGSWSTWKAFCSERGFALPKGCFAYNGILHFLDTDTGTSVLTYDPYESPDRFNQIPLPNGRQSSHSCLIFSGDKEMLKYCEIDSTGGSGVDRLSIWRLVHSEWCLEGEFRIPSVVYECRSLMVAPNPWNRDVICHPYVMINKFTVVNTRAGTMKMIRVLDDQTMLLEFYSDLLIDNDYPLIPIELCPWSSPCYVSN